MGMLGVPVLILVFTCMIEPPCGMPPVFRLSALGGSLCRMAAHVNKKLFPFNQHISRDLSVS
jgi:hypothetical protein